jgi:hypothetical protein
MAHHGPPFVSSLRCRRRRVLLAKCGPSSEVGADHTLC